MEVFATKYMLDVNAANGTGDYCFVEWINRDIVCDTLNT